jgi:hypothetical protein
MTFRCPQCASPASLEITRSIALPPDSRSDEIMLQVVECSGCGFLALAVYEESRRGAFGSESWDHSAYRIVGAALDKLIRLIGECPQPGDPRCDCPSHRSLGKTDPQGRWQGLEGVEILSTYRMDMA